MSRLSRTAKYYCERAGLEPTYRGPLPRVFPGANSVHTVPLAVPLPAPEALLRNAPETPDIGPTPLWPHGIDGETPQA